MAAEIPRVKFSSLRRMNRVTLLLTTVSGSDSAFVRHVKLKYSM